MAPAEVTAALVCQPNIGVLPMAGVVTIPATDETPRIPVPINVPRRQVPARNVVAVIACISVDENKAPDPCQKM